MTEPVRLLLGSYTDHIFDVNFYPATPTSAPRLEPKAELPIGPRASWLCVHPRLPNIWYAALESHSDAAVAVYDILPQGQGVKELGRVMTKERPCHVAVVASGKALAVANFELGGSILLVPLAQDGTFLASLNSMPNYIRFEPKDRGERTAHQCADVPVLGECWIVEPHQGGVLRMKLEEGPDGLMTWREVGFIETLWTHGPRQIIVTPNAKHLYTVHARSCVLSHHDVSDPDHPVLVSQYTINPPGHEVNMATRGEMDNPIAGAVSYHAPSETLMATSRMLKDTPTDSVAFFKRHTDGSITPQSVLQPKSGRGKEFRGVGLVGDSYLVAGQHDGWMSCFTWNREKDLWEETPLDPPVNLEKVVDIQVCRV